MIKLNKEAEAKHKYMLQISQEGDLLRAQLQYIRLKNAQLIQQELQKQKAYQAQSAKNNRLKEKLSQLKNQHFIAKKVLSGLQTRDLQLSEKINSQSEAYLKLTLQTSNLQRGIPTNQNKLHQLNQIVSNTAQKFEKAEEEIVEFKKKIDQKKATVQVLDKRITLIENQIAGLSIKIKPYQ